MSYERELWLLDKRWGDLLVDTLLKELPWDSLKESVAKEVACLMTDKLLMLLILENVTCLRLVAFY